MLFFSSKFLPLKITLWGDSRRKNLKKKIGLKWFQMVYSARNVKKNWAEAENGENGGHPSVFFRFY